MQVILQRISDGLYYDRLQSWTKDPALAQPFESSLEATLFCCNLKLPAANVVIRFGDPRYDVRLKCTKCGGLPSD